MQRRPLFSLSWWWKLISLLCSVIILTGNVLVPHRRRTPLLVLDQRSVFFSLLPHLMRFQVHSSSVRMTLCCSPAYWQPVMWDRLEKARHWTTLPCLLALCRPPLNSINSSALQEVLGGPPITQRGILMTVSAPKEKRGRENWVERANKEVGKGEYIGKILMEASILKVKH